MNHKSRIFMTVATLFYYLALLFFFDIRVILVHHVNTLAIPNLNFGEEKNMIYYHFGLQFQFLMTWPSK